nr:phospholipase-like protein [Tanacetum cinerariifolium]
MLLVGGETENVLLYYHMYDNFHIQFGREEFCLVTGLKFGVEYSADYDDEDRPIPFRRRVFSSCLDGEHITGKNVEDLIKSKSFKKLDDNDAVSLCCIGILQRYPRVVSLTSNKKFYRHMLRDFLHGRVPVERLIPDEVEAGSGWWLSSRAYFDGCVTEAERRPRGDDVVITGVHDTAIYFTYVNVDPNKLAIMNLGHQFDNAITAKDELRKAYEECRDIPLVRVGEFSPPYYIYQLGEVLIISGSFDFGDCRIIYAWASEVEGGFVSSFSLLFTIPHPAVLPRVLLSFQSSACCLSTLHFLMFMRDNSEVLKFVDNSLEVFMTRFDNSVTDWTMIE